MSEKNIFVIRNQFDQYLDKHQQWQTGQEPQSLFRSAFNDEALNTLIEVNAKDILLRGNIIAVAMDDKKRPIVEISEQALELQRQQNLMAATATDEQATATSTAAQNSTEPAAISTSDNDQQSSLSDSEQDAQIAAMLAEQQRLLNQS